MNATDPCNALAEARREQEAARGNPLREIQPITTPLAKVTRSQPTGRGVCQALHRADMYLSQGNPHMAQVVIQDTLRVLEGGE
jgi:hypothetical protein